MMTGHEIHTEQNAALLANGNIKALPPWESSDDLDNLEQPNFKHIDLPYGLNAEDLWGDLADWDATDQEKTEWLTALAHIVKGFVDWGLGQDTVQMLLAQNFVDSFDNNQSDDTTDSVNMVEPKNNHS